MSKEIDNELLTQNMNSSPISEIQDYIIQKIYSQISQKGHIIYDIIELYKQIFFEKYLYQFDFKMDKQKIVQKDLEEIKENNKKIYLDINNLLKFLNNIISFTYKQILEIFFTDSNFLNLKILSILLRLVFRIKNLYVFIEKVISLEYIKEEEYFQYYLSKKYDSITLDEFKIYFKGQEDEKYPFIKTIEQFKKVECTTSPWGKFIKIAQISEIMHNEVENYRKQSNIGEILLESELVMNIMAYSLIKTNQYKWFRHYRFIELFTPPEILYQYGIHSFYITYFEICCQSISNWGKELQTNHTNQSQLKNFKQNQKNNNEVKSWLSNSSDSSITQQIKFHGQQDYQFQISN